MNAVNLFLKNKGLDYLRDIYSLTPEMVSDVLQECFDYISKPFPTVKDNSFPIFLDKTGISPDVFDLSQIKIHCAHITTAYDNAESIKKYGLIPVTRLLEEKSVLSDFLKANGVEVGVTEHSLKYNDKRFYLPSLSDQCDYNYWDDVYLLCSTLYHDHGEVEAFASADEQTMMTYSTVSRYPEILLSIDTAIRNLTGDRLNLGCKWVAHGSHKTIRVEFDVSLDEMSYIGEMGDIKITSISIRLLNNS